MSIFSQGISLSQHKDPALSGGIIPFIGLNERRLAHSGFADLSEVEPNEILEIAKTAEIVDEADGKAIYRKMQRARGAAAIVIADAVDDEPYVSSKMAPALFMGEEMLAGLMLCQKTGGTDRAIIMMNRHPGHLQARIPKEIGGIEVIRLQGGYPAQPTPDRLRLGKLSGRKMIISAGALVHLSRAVMQAKAQTTAFITVAGNCVAHPMNLEVSLGVTVSQVLERCGLTHEPKKIVCGGPMTGFEILDAERTIITKNTRAILAFRQSDTEYNYTCIGCGKCEVACPNGLNPMYIRRLMKLHFYPPLAPFDAHLCIGCGTCSYVCPSRLNLVESMLEARAYARAHFNLAGGDNP
jgi:Predicted NADH:ubiquinone oxidoreductase, subunit RnfC